MIEQLKKRLPHLADKLEKYAGLYKMLEVPAHTVLLREGEISKRAIQIDRGCIRVFFNKDGRDVTCQFFFEGQGVSSAESFRKNVPSVFTIETIEPSVLQVLSKKDFDLIMKDLSQDAAFMREINEATFERQLHYMNKFLSFIRDTPAERYRNLVKESPHILQRVPQHYIASYLGITPVSLSRIRARLKSR